MKYLLILILLTFLGLRFYLTQPVYKDGDTIRITTRVSKDPIKYDKSQYIKAAGLGFYLPLFPEVFYGDKIVVEGVVENGKLANPMLIKIVETEKSVYSFRNNLISFYQSVLPEPAAGLVAGITLGSKGALTADFWEMVKNTGVAHVVVASGTNVTFVTSFLVAFLTVFLPRRKMIPLALLGILLYLFVSGFDAPLVRAAIMSGALFVAQEKGSLVSPWYLLTLSAYLMLLINPSWLFDLGFILSFVSTSSLMLFQKKVVKYFKFLPNFLRDGFSTSMAAQIGVAPILFVTFGHFNIWSPLINALVLWTVPFIMIAGALAGVLFVIAPVFAKAILLIVYPVILWFVKVVALFN